MRLQGKLAAAQACHRAGPRPKTSGVELMRLRTLHVANNSLSDTHMITESQSSTLVMVMLAKLSSLLEWSACPSSSMAEVKPSASRVQESKVGRSARQAHQVGCIRKQRVTRSFQRVVLTSPFSLLHVSHSIVTLALIVCHFVAMERPSSAYPFLTDSRSQSAMNAHHSNLSKNDFQLSLNRSRDIKRTWRDSVGGIAQNVLLKAKASIDNMRGATEHETL